MFSGFGRFLFEGNHPNSDSETEDQVPHEERDPFQDLIEDLQTGLEQPPGIEEETMPAKPNPIIPADATDEEAAAMLKSLQKERTVAKREFTRRKNILDRMLRDDPSQKDTQELAKIAMAELTQQHNLVLEKNQNLELNLSDGEEDNFIDEVNDGMKQTQLLYIQWKQAGQHDVPVTPTPARTTEAVYSVIGLNFDVRKIMRDKFSGEDIRSYASFRINWTSVAGRLTEMGYSSAQKLMELKKCLDKDALELVKRLPDEDAQYERALTLLDRNFQDNIKIAELVITDLLNTPKMSHTAESIGATYNAMIQAEQTLDGLRVTDQQRGQLLFNVICESKLNNNLLRQWAQAKNKKRNEESPLGHDATKDDLLNLILEHKHIVKRLEENKEKPEKKEDDKKPANNQQRPPQHQSNRRSVGGTFPINGGKDSGSQRSPPTCQICQKSGHKGPDCFVLKNLHSGQERRDFLAQNKINICRNCLKGPHQTKECRQATCSVRNCGMRHHTLLHEDRERQRSSHPTQSGSGHGPTQPRTNPPTQGSANEEKQVHVIVTPTKATKQPILQSCQAWAIAPSGEKILATCFLDSGSELTIIRRDLSEMLGLQGPTTKLQLNVAGGSALPITTEKEVRFQLQSLDGTYISPKMTAVTSKQITRDLRPIDISTDRYAHLKNIMFTDSYPSASKTVDILIGVEHYTNLLKNEVVKGKPEEPMALSTKLGYVLTGSA